jgi:DNA invertase Pin-like site-specific DNA recombinase
MTNRKRSGMSKIARARRQRLQYAAKGGITRDFEYGKYTIHPESLANLVIGRDKKARAARIRASTIRRLMVEGKSVADIVLITGISRAAIYRLSGERQHWAASDGRTACGAFAPPAAIADDDDKVNCRLCLRTVRDPLLL